MIKKFNILPADNNIIAIQDPKINTSSFKDFEYDKDDIYKQLKLFFNDIEIEVIHSEKLYSLIFKSLKINKNLFFDNDLETENFIKYINIDKKIKFFYILPKEVLKIITSRDISYTIYDNTYCLMFLNKVNEIIILIQSTKPLITLDVNLLSIILKYIAQGYIRYIFENFSYITSDKYNNKTIKEYIFYVKKWYYTFIKLLLDKYNLFPQNINDTLKEKIISENLSLLLNIILNLKATKNKEAYKEKILKFFSSDIPKYKLQENNTFKLEFLKDYYHKFYKHIKEIIENDILQSETILSNKDYFEIINIIKESYYITNNKLIDFTYIINNTILQELTRISTVAENFFLYKNNIKEILRISFS